MTIGCLLESGHLALSPSTLPPFATHLLKYARWSLPDPLALPAAGFPGSRGGNCLAVRTLHFLASSAVIAEARSGTQPSTMQVSASSVRPDAKLPNMTPLPLLAATARSAHQSFAPTPPIILAGFGMDERPCSRPATWSDFQSMRPATQQIDEFGRFDTERSRPTAPSSIAGNASSAS
jgi:hypothetical protein